MEYAKQLNLKVDNKKLEKDGVLTYNNETGIASVVLNGRRVLYGPSLGNAVIKNNRMIVNAEKVWYDLIGRVYGDINSIPEGGTWTPGKYTLELGVYTFRSKTYIPYELARDMVIQLNSPVNDEITILIEGSSGTITKALINSLINSWSARYDYTLDANLAGFTISALFVFMDISIAKEKQSFIDTVEDCQEDEYVTIATKRNYDAYTREYGTSAEIDDEYSTYQTGTFQTGIYNDIPSFSIF